MFRECDVDPDFKGSTDQKEGEMNDYLLIDFDCFFYNGQDSILEEESNISSLHHKDPDDKNFVKFMQEKDFIMKLGNGDVPQGLELAIRFLSLGACAIVRCHSKYAHPHGRKNNCEGIGSIDLPASKDVIYRVYLRSIKSIAQDQSYTFRLKVAKQLKSIGNDYYINEWIGPRGGCGKVKSLKAYDGSSNELVSLVKDLNADTSNNYEKLKGDTVALLVDCFNNIAAAHLRDKDYTKARDAAVEAIKLDPNNVKALCRAAKAAMCVGAFEESDMALDAAIELEKDNIDVQKLKVDHDRRVKLYRKKEKVMYTKMMNRNVHNTDINRPASPNTNSERVNGQTIDHSSVDKNNLNRMNEMEVEARPSFKDEEGGTRIVWRRWFLAALFFITFAAALNHVSGVGLLNCKQSSSEL